MTSEAVVQRQVEAYNARSIEDFLETYDERIEIYDLPSNTPTLVGKDELRKLYEPLLLENPNLHVEIKSRIVQGAFVIDEEWVTGASKYPDGLHAPVVYQIENALIRRVWFVG